MPCSVVVGYHFTLKMTGGLDRWNVGIIPQHYAASQPTAANPSNLARKRKN